MVGWLVENQQVRLHDEHIGKRHSLQLAARQLRERLIEFCDVQLCEHLLRPYPIHLRLVLVHLVDVQRPIARLQHIQFHGHVGVLLQIAHPDAVFVDDGALVVAVTLCQDVQQRGLTRSVLGYQTHMLPFGNAKGDVLEKNPLAHPSREPFYL